MAGNASLGKNTHSRYPSVSESASYLIFSNLQTRAPVISSPPGVSLTIPLPLRFPFLSPFPSSVVFPFRFPFTFQCSVTFPVPFPFHVPIHCSLSFPSPFLTPLHVLVTLAVIIISNDPNFCRNHAGVADGSDGSDGTLYRLMQNYTVPVAQTTGHIAYLPPLLWGDEYAPSERHVCSTPRRGSSYAEAMETTPGDVYAFLRPSATLYLCAIAIYQMPHSPLIFSVLRCCHILQCILHFGYIACSCICFAIIVFYSSEI